MTEESPSLSETSPSFIPGHAPHEKDVQYSIGPYQVLKDIGKGGMGEVLLAYDTKCGRRVALKKIRADLVEYKQLHNRFLKEARITSQLTHPAIMPIYTIEDTNKIVYYTMPFVHGETLKQIFRTTREQEKKGERLHHLGGSILALIRIFISVCQAIAYSHSKGVLHRDLKPENIMIGEYGEILILDWGLAKLIASSEPEETMPENLPSGPSLEELTRPGKVVGTLNFMAPERAYGEPATVQTEIYSLGVILYQILTLRNPFNRESLEDFRMKMDKETVQEPAAVAPYRDVPRLLSRLAMKCLSKDPTQRYATVDELLVELENYVEGRSEWFHIADLDIKKKEDWEFQENVLIAEHIAITRGPEVSDWVSLMISKASYPENTKVEAELTIGPTGNGVGFLLSIPEAPERFHLNDGYCLWIGSDLNRLTKLLRSTVEVIHAPEIFLERGKTYSVRIEKIDHNIYFYLNDILQFSYISHLPLIGTHVGILSRDADFALERFSVYAGSQNITVNCLAVPDAFLAHKDYHTALTEYRRIGYSFPGRAEGREAMFRAGITILEQTKNTELQREKEKLFEQALEEFEKLHTTPGAPLEYLGKAHVYQAMGDFEEEIKCYEIGFRKYPKHPLLYVLHEQLVYRMHETSRAQRKATYLFMLTALKHLPQPTASSHTKKLFESLQKHWEPLPFFEEDPKEGSSEEIKQITFRIKLAFWLANPLAIEEIIEEITQEPEPSPITLANALFSLIELGDWRLAKEKFDSLAPETLNLRELKLIRLAIACHEASPEKALEDFIAEQYTRLDKGEQRLLLHLMETSIARSQVSLCSLIYSVAENYNLSKERMVPFTSKLIWAFLLENNWDKAGNCLHQYPLAVLTRDTSPLFILYGCWLAATENQDIAEIHFSGTLDVRYPRTWTLLSYYLNKKIDEQSIWTKKAFMWEKRKLYQQIALFYHCTGDFDKRDVFLNQERNEYLS